MRYSRCKQTPLSQEWRSSTKRSLSQARALGMNQRHPFPRQPVAGMIICQTWLQLQAPVQGPELVAEAAAALPLPLQLQPSSPSWAGGSSHFQSDTIFQHRVGLPHTNRFRNFHSADDLDVRLNQLHSIGYTANLHPNCCWNSSTQSNHRCQCH